MAIQSVQFQPVTTGISYEVIFAGDHVRLAGQIDYPNLPVPKQGYPLLFILPNACCTSRKGFQQHQNMANQMGYAVFRWDKRGTGRSASGGRGYPEQDAILAYQAAVEQADIDSNRIVIWAQTDASLLLAENFSQFQTIQQPLGIILAGNMLDEQAILKLNTRIFCVTGERDWNNPIQFAKRTADAHNAHYNMQSEAYIAQYANRKLIDTRNNIFHAGVKARIQDWLTDLCPIFTSI